MPVVPTYEPRVREQALEGGFQRAPDVGRGLAQAGEAMMRVADVADRIDLRDAQAKAFDAEAKIASDWLEWDGLARQKYRGQNVGGYAKAAEEWWEKAAETYGKELDPRARTLVNKSLAEKRLQAITSVATFVNAEKERHADETYAANVLRTIQFGVTTGEVAGTAQQIRKMAAVVGARKGWTIEQTEAEALKNLSNLHLAHVTKLAEKRPEDAQAYYDANKAEISFEHQPRIEEIIKGEVDNRRAREFAASVANKPLGEQLEEAAAKIKDPELLEKTIIQIRNNYALVKQAREEEEAAAAKQAWQLFDQGRPIPEAILSQMDWHARAQLKASIRARAERLAAGRPVKTDFNAWYEVQGKIARGEPVDLRAYTEKISISDLQALAKAQQTTAKPGELEAYFTKQQRVEGAFLELTGKPAKDDPARAHAFGKAYENALMAESAAKKRALTPAEEQDILDRVIKDMVYVKGFFSNAQMPASLVPKEDQASMFVVVPLLDAKGAPKLGKDGKPLTKRQPLAEIPQWFRAESIKSGARTEQQIAEDYNAAKAKGLVK